MLSMGMLMHEEGGKCETNQIMFALQAISVARDMLAAASCRSCVDALMSCYMYFHVYIIMCLLNFPFPASSGPSCGVSLGFGPYWPLVCAYPLAAS